MSRKRTSQMICVGIPNPVHEELKEYATPRGMKLRFLVPLLWETFKLAKPDQIEQASKRTVERVSKGSA